jgi:putative aminopeptidase FrvX
MASKDLHHQFKNLAKKHTIPLQVGATGGGTDGAAIQRSGMGSRMMALSVAIRYLHSTVELCHMEDLQNLVKLLVVGCQELQA